MRRHAPPKRAQQNEEPDILPLLATLCLSSAMHVRIMRSMLITHIRLPTENGYITAHTRATKAFAEAGNKLSEEDILTTAQIRERLGLAHIAGFNALVATFKAQAQGQQLERSQGCIQANAQKGWRAYLGQVNHSVVSKNWGQATKKLEVRVEERNCSAQQFDVHHLWQDMKVHILSCNEAEELPGVAPRGDLERKLQEYLAHSK